MCKSGAENVLRRILAILLCAVLVAGNISVTAYAQEQAEEPDVLSVEEAEVPSAEELVGDPEASGTAGSLTWAVEDGVLTISGNGPMRDYYTESAPWYDYRDSVTKLVIEDGVTSIGMCAFQLFTSLTELEVADSVETIGIWAFLSCTGLTTLRIPAGVKTVKEWAFGQCENLKYVFIPSSVETIQEKAFYGCEKVTDVFLYATDFDRYSFFDETEVDYSGSDWTYDFNGSEHTTLRISGSIDMEELAQQDNKVAKWYQTNPSSVMNNLPEDEFFEIIPCEVTVNPSEFGTVTANRTSTWAGDTIILTGHGDEGYVIESLQVTDEDGGEVPVTKLGRDQYSFVIPGNVTVDAEFGLAFYNINLPEDAEHGSVESSLDEAKFGDSVKLFVDPDTDYKLVELTVTTAGGTQIPTEDTGAGWYEFVMPGEDVNVSAAYALKEYLISVNDYGRADSVRVIVDGDDEATRAAYGDLVVIEVEPSSGCVLDGAALFRLTDGGSSYNAEGVYRHLENDDHGYISFYMDFDMPARATTVGINLGLLHQHDDITFHEDWGENYNEQHNLPTQVASSNATTFYLTSDVELSDTWKPEANIRLCLNGHTVTLKSYGCGMLIQDRNIVICDHTGEGKIIADPSNTDPMCLVGVERGSLTLDHVTLEGGSVSSLYAGGAVTLKLNGSELTMNSCTVRDCEGYYAGAVYVGKGTAVLNDCTITGNTSASVAGVRQAGGIVAESGTSVTLNNCSVTDNSAWDQEDTGGVLVEPEVDFTLSGKCEISSNTVLGNNSFCNLLLRGGTVVTLDGELDPMSRIGVRKSTTPTVEEPVTITSGINGENYLLPCFTSDNPIYTIGFSGDEIAVGLPAAVTIRPGAGSGETLTEMAMLGGDYLVSTCSFMPPEGKTFAGWLIDGNDALTNPGDRIPVTGDIVMTAAWKDGSGGAVLDPHSHVWLIEADENDPSAATYKCISPNCNNYGEPTTIQIVINNQAAPFTKTYDGSAVTEVWCRLYSYGNMIGNQDDLPEGLSAGPVIYVNEDGSEAENGARDAGVYRAQVTVSDDNNPDLCATIEQTITINPLPLPVRVEVEGFTDLPLTEEEQELAAASISSGNISDYGAVMYRLGEDGEWSDSVPTASESGTYTVYWYFKGHNYTDMGSEDEPYEVTASISELHEHDGLRFVQWTDTDSLPSEEGNYFLQADVTLPEKTIWTISGSKTINLCLNGKTIDGNYGSVRIASGAALNLFDEDGGVLTNFYYVDGIEVSGTLTMKGGTIRDDKTRRLGSEVFSGGVLINNGGVFNAEGVTIEDMNGEYNGCGIVTVDEGGTFRMTDGTIRNSRSNRGVVYVNGGTFEIAGSPVITGNAYSETSDPLSNVYLTSGSRITVVGELGEDASIGVRVQNMPSEGNPVVLTSGLGTWNPDIDVTEVFSSDYSYNRYYLTSNDDGEAEYALHVHAYSLTADPDDPASAVVECVNEGCYEETYGRVAITAEDAAYDGELHGVSKQLEGSTGVLKELEVSSADKCKIYDIDGNEMETAYSINSRGRAVRDPGVYTAKITAVLTDNWEHPTVTGEDMEVELVTTFSIIKETAITFASGGAEGTMDPAAANIGTHYELPDCAFEAPENMTFAGWQVGEDTEELRQAGDVITVTEDMTVTAVWAEVPAGPTIEKHSLTLAKGAIGVNFYMNLPESDAYDYSDSRMDFTVSGKGGESSFDAYDPDETNADGTLFEFSCFVNSIQMADTITATFTYKENGEEKTVSETYSIREYIAGYMELVDDPDAQVDRSAEGLVKALANFGHYSQLFLSSERGWEIGEDHAEMDLYYTEYFGEEYNNIDEELMLKLSGSGLPNKTLKGNIKGMSMSLALDSETAMYVYVTLTSGISGSINAKVDFEEPAGLTKQSKTRFKVMLPRVAIQDLDKEFHIEASSGSDEEWSEANVSALCYIRSYIMTQDNDEGKAAMAALYDYHKSAVEFMNMSAG